eukprot:1157486-Pelagomonas_calceolata.AAC.7
MQRSKCSASGSLWQACMQGLVDINVNTCGQKDRSEFLLLSNSYANLMLVQMLCCVATAAPLPIA